MKDIKYKPISKLIDIFVKIQDMIIKKYGFDKKMIKLFFTGWIKQFNNKTRKIDIDLDTAIQINEELDYDGSPYNNCIGSHNVLDVLDVLRQFTEEEIYIIADDLGIALPDYIDIVKDVIKIDIKKNIKSQFQDAIKNAKDNPDNAIEEARTAALKFIKHYLNDKTCDEDDLQKKIRKFFKDKNIYDKDKKEPNAVIGNICNYIISIGNSIEILRRTITDAHVEGCIKDENLAVFIINCLASVCYFFDNIDDNTNKSQEESNEIDNIDDDIPF